MSNLPQRYAYAVARNLPEAQRDEVSRELQATIEDMAADRAKNGKPTEADYKAVLKELGNPDHLSHKYTASKRYLIGPRFYDAYLRLLKLLLSIVPGIVAAVMLAVGFAEGGQPVMATIVEAIGAGIMAGVQVAFWVTLVFAILERAGIKPEELEGAWTPEQLPQVPKNTKRQISVAEGVSGAVLLGLFMAWVALSPIIHLKDGAPLLNPELWNFWMPVFFVLTGLTLVQEAAQAKIGNWTTTLVVTNALLSVASLVFLVALLSTQQVINPAYVEAWGWNKSEGFDEAMRWTGAIAVASTIGIYVWEIAQSMVLNRRFVKTQNK
ncbi:MAG TPA: hypothetical protein VJM46_00795 [Candidatus Saccharimonadales bacterium]|nr:hypothetical protein [Candidatus Saccharimonadales bacterium]